MGNVNNPLNALRNRVASQDASIESLTDDNKRLALEVAELSKLVERYSQTSAGDAIIYSDLMSAVIDALAAIHAGDNARAISILSRIAEPVAVTPAKAAREAVARAGYRVELVPVEPVEEEARA